MCKIVIIGNSASGIAAAEEIVKNLKNYHLTIISREEKYGYYRVMLSEYLSDTHNKKSFILHDAEWYLKNNIDLKLSHEVKEINEKNKSISIISKEGDKTECIEYDKLVIATGSHNFIPPIKNSDLSNVYSLRTIKDADIIKIEAKKSKSVVIIGGGLLGLEVGFQLKKLDIDVTVIEMMNRLLPRQLDENAAKIFEEKIKLSGVKVLKGVGINAIRLDALISSRANGVELSSGEIIPCDFTIISAGVRSNTDITDNTSINVNRGIVVDSHMMTSNQNIYACGDVAEFQGNNFSLWPEAISQGKIAGFNISGIEKEYDGFVPFTMYRGFGMKLFSIGDIGNDERKNYDIEALKDEKNYQCLYFIDDVFVGGVLLGDISKAVLLKKSVKEKCKKQDLMNAIGK